MLIKDVFNQPVNLGDQLAWSASIHRSAELRVGRLVSIVPLVPHRTRQGYYMRADQTSQASPTVFSQRAYDRRPAVLKAEIRRVDMQGNLVKLETRTISPDKKIVRGPR